MDLNANKVLTAPPCVFVFEFGLAVRTAGAIWGGSPVTGTAACQNKMAAVWQHFYRTLQRKYANTSCFLAE